MSKPQFVAQAPCLKGIVQKREESADGKAVYVKVGELSLWEKDPTINRGFNLGGNLQLNGQRLYVWIQSNGSE